MARPTGSPTRRHAVLGARQRAWNALRVYKVFTAAEIGPVADIGAANLQKYLLALHRAGYLRLERAKRNGRVCGHAVHRLARNSGPRCPIVRTDGSGVYDPNTRTVYPFAQEEPADGTLDEHAA